MARRRREYEDDDGRTIADMSDVSRPSLMGRRTPERPEDSLSRESSGGSDDYIPPEDRKWYVLGALKATLLIALAFIVGLGIVIFVLLKLWGA